MKKRKFLLHLLLATIIVLSTIKPVFATSNIILQAKEALPIDEWYNSLSLEQQATVSANPLCFLIFEGEYPLSDFAPDISE